jgi:hypothetical protein
VGGSEKPRTDKYKVIACDWNYDASFTLTSLPVWDFKNLKCLIFVAQNVHMKTSVESCQTQELGIQKARERVEPATNEFAVLAAVTNSPHASTRELSPRGSEISRTSVRILHRRKFYLHHLSLHQELHGNDFSNRVKSCHFAIHQLQNNNSLFGNVLFTGEASLKTRGQLSLRNMYY